LDDGSCPLTAVVSGNTFFVDPGATCSIQGPSTTGATCTVAITLTSGSGSRSPGSINYRLAGTEQTACSDGTSASGTEAETVTGSE
jgi:hypothetical protein